MRILSGPQHICGRRRKANRIKLLCAINYTTVEEMSDLSPHRKLKAEEAIVLRRLRTGTSVSLHELHKIHPTAFTDICPWCGSKSTLHRTASKCTPHSVEPHMTNPYKVPYKGTAGHVRPRGPGRPLPKS